MCTQVEPRERRDTAVDAVERNAVALTRIVEDVLDMSRIASGKVHLDVQRVDVGQVVSGAAPEMDRARRSSSAWRVPWAHGIAAAARPIPAVRRRIASRMSAASACSPSTMTPRRWR